MWTLDAQPVFADAECSVRRSADRLRHATQTPVHGHGTTVVAQGREAVEWEQVGRLVADDRAQLEATLDAIRERLDGRPRTLAEDGGGSHPALVMTAVHAEPPERFGPRWAVRFTVRYLQVTP